MIRLPEIGALKLPWISDHGSEIALFAAIASGVIALVWFAISKGAIEKLDVAACLLVLQSIISAVKERWTQRSVDRMGQQLGQSAPPPSPVDVVEDPPAPAIAPVSASKHLPPPRAPETEIIE